MRVREENTVGGREGIMCFVLDATDNSGVIIPATGKEVGGWGLGWGTFGELTWQLNFISTDNTLC